MTTPVHFAKLPHPVNPLSKYWRQPARLRDRVRIYQTHATISEQDWHALPDYRSSIPSGVYAGKVWRSGPWLCWYGRAGADGLTSIGRARALIQGPGTNVMHQQYVRSDRA